MAPFYYHPRMLWYDFGPQHPLKPERLRKTIDLLAGVTERTLGAEPSSPQSDGCQAPLPVTSTDPGSGSEQDALRVHDAPYIDAIRHADDLSPEQAWPFGFGTGDTPIFSNMLEASLAYMAGSAAAARTVNQGANLAFNLSGGLHHAQRANASGFCVLNDCAVAISILREKFDKVAYVDIDVHHGDGVQAIFYDDPTVMTCSIHQDGRTLYPGTGFVNETGAENTSINVPLMPGTTGDVWIWAFRSVIMAALRKFEPQAIVLQMGADSQIRDPLAQIENTVQDWLEAVSDIRDLNLPTVALGGGGYDVKNVIRMWSAAYLALNRLPVPDSFPEPFRSEWGIPTFLDPPQTTSAGREQAEKVAAWFQENVW